MQPGVAVHFKNCNAMKTKYECRASVALAALMLALSGCIQDEILYAGTSNSDAVSENTATDSSSSGISSERRRSMHSPPICISSNRH